MNDQIAIPSVHRNGTSQEELVEALTKASLALFDATAPLAACSPNQRDYYLQPDSVWKMAVEQHSARVAALHKVREELVAIAEAILDGGAR
mgnify:CR=1 FL=1